MSGQIMDRDDKTLDNGLIDLPLSESDSQWIRACSQCDGQMTVTAKEAEKFEGPGREFGLRFACQRCDHRVSIASSLTIFTNLASALMVVCGGIYAFSNGLGGFIVYAATQSIPWFFGALFLTLFVLVFAAGGFLLFVSGIEKIRARKKHPLLSGSSGNASLIVTAILGLMPWVLATIAGMLNDLYLDVEPWVAYAIMPIIFAPIFLAPKLNASMTGTFFASAIWLFLGVSVIWMT